jgi:hypothetical protein
VLDWFVNRERQLYGNGLEWVLNKGGLLCSKMLYLAGNRLGQLYHKVLNWAVYR